jgi:hypothetical protein
MAAQVGSHGEVQFDHETRQQRDARIKKLKDSGEAEWLAPAEDHRSDYVAKEMSGGHTPSAKGGRGGKGGPPRKRGTKMCRYESCGLEARVCGCAQVGRRKLSEEKSKWLRPYLPRDYHEFLKRSRLSISDVLEAVLDSPAMKCWRHHAHFVPMRSFDEEGNDLKRTAYDEKVLERREDAWELSWRDPDERGLEFLKDLRPNIGPKKPERVTPELLKRFRAIGKAADKKWGARYSDSRFCAYCIAYYISCLRLVQECESREWERTSSREEAKLVKAVATRCFECERLEQITATRNISSDLATDPRRDRFDLARLVRLTQAW